MSNPEQPVDRVTVVETVYHSPYNKQPINIDNRFSRQLVTQSQCYERYLTATEEWTQLESGWLKDNVGMMILANEEGKDLQTIPSEEEKEDLERRILAVALEPIHSNMWLIPPGESMRGCPSSLDNLWICSLHSSVKYRMFLVPG